MNSSMTKNAEDGCQVAYTNGCSSNPPTTGQSWPKPNESVRYSTWAVPISAWRLLPAPWLEEENDKEEA